MTSTDSTKTAGEQNQSNRPAMQAPATTALPTAVEDLTSRLAQRVGAERYQRWFGTATLRVDGNEVNVQTESRFAADWIGRKFTDDLSHVAREALGEAARVRINYDEPAERKHPQKKSAPAQGVETSARRDDSVRSANGVAARESATLPRTTDHANAWIHSLDDFVVGSSNRLAYAAATQLADDQPAQGLSPLFIHGECGVGKTHLLKGICRRFLERRNSRVKMRYVTGEAFTNEYIAAVRNHSLETFRKRLRSLDLLAIDDIHFLSNKTRTQAEFLHTLDAINLTGARVVLASDAHPRYIKCFSEALVSRFLSGMVVRIDRPDRETRLQLVYRLATQRTVNIGDAAARLIADNCGGSIRDLQGVVTKLAALQRFNMNGSATNGVSTVFVQQLLREHGWQQCAHVRMDIILDVVCKNLGITFNDLRSRRKHRMLVLGRGLVAYLGRDMSDHSFPEIAEALGRVSHAGVHDAAGRITRQLESDELVRFGPGRQSMPISQLIDDLRHEIRRVARGGE